MTKTDETKTDKGEAEVTDTSINNYAQKPKQIIRLLRGDRNERIGYFVAIVCNNKGDIGIGYSLCRAGDRFDGMCGLTMAYQRAGRHRAKNDYQIKERSAQHFKQKPGCMVIPEKLIENGLCSFLCDCQRIYGFDHMPSWASAIRRLSFTS